MRYAHGKTIASLLTAALLLATACESADFVATTDQLGAVITVVDNGPALSSARSFVLPDTVVRLSANGAGMGHEASVAIVNSVRAHLLRLGWTDLTAIHGARPDVIVLIAAAERIQTSVAYADWFLAWGYLPYWGPSVNSASVWGVPSGAIPFAFEAGTVLITMLDLRAQRGTTDDIPLLWAAGLDGVVTTPTNTLSRALRGIDQAFVQSPYLRLR
jgi:hypothetical protein